MFLIGLTGGAATGKSTASSYFRNLGVPVIDADEVARKIVEPGEPAFLEIKATFGQDVIDTVTGNIVSFRQCLKSSHVIFHVSFTFLVMLFWTSLVRFSGPPTPSFQKE